MQQSRTFQTVIELNKRFPGGAPEVLSKFNPGNQVQFCRDAERVFFGKAPALDLITEAYGRSTAESWLEIQLNDLLEFAGCKEKLRKEQMEELAAMIYEEYSYFKLTEFMLFFQRFKRCEYGKFYGVVDPMVILQALASFNDECRRIHCRKQQQQYDEQQRQAEAEVETTKKRYISRVDGAFTDEAVISFVQYQVMDYDGYSDEEFGREMNGIRSGEIKLPKGITELMEFKKARR